MRQAETEFCMTLRERRKETETVQLHFQNEPILIAMQHVDDRKVYLNVGGKLFSSHAKDLEKMPDSMLSHLLDKSWKEASSTGNVNLPSTKADIEQIKQETEFYQLNSIKERLNDWEKKSQGKGPPFFIGDRVRLKSTNLYRIFAKEYGWKFDGSSKKVPLSMQSFNLFSPPVKCGICGLNSSSVSGLYKNALDYPRSQLNTTGEVKKIYGLCCCIDVSFGRSSTVFHLPSKLFRIAQPYE
ncbi:hypothetical protein WR25_03654 [Diploscapter pachys]|uniref:Potassium channel tetramerisation-type BTB domain-containing protein n=1 Tax=Diploscapter pachys TaxID=2018661 RepID=A0A2A2KMV0_9BILA|nr:hypothetical protein WR25_03654 [Diploscapter pachys]